MDLWSLISTPTENWQRSCDHNTNMQWQLLVGFFSGIREWLVDLYRFCKSLATSSKSAGRFIFFSPMRCSYNCKIIMTKTLLLFHCCCSKVSFGLWIPILMSTYFGLYYIHRHLYYESDTLGWRKTGWTSPFGQQKLIHACLVLSKFVLPSGSGTRIVITCSVGVTKEQQKVLILSSSKAAVSNSSLVVLIYTNCNLPLMSHIIDGIQREVRVSSQSGSLMYWVWL